MTPAGILYMPAHEPAPALPRNAGEEEVEAASEKGYTMNGLLLDNQDVLCAMEPDLAGRFLPVSLSRTSKSESLKGNYLAAAEDFQNLELYTEGAPPLYGGSAAFRRDRTGSLSERGQAPLQLLRFPGGLRP